MAQVNITISKEEILQVLTGNRDDAFKFLLERILNEIMMAESEEKLGAAMHERSEERTDYRNGTRERSLVTRIGTLNLQVPRHRNEPFHTMIFDQYQRSEASLIATMVQMVIAGVSTRKVSDVVETLCGQTFSKSTVSELCKKIDDDIKKFKDRPLKNSDAPFLMVDATYFKAREDHRVKSKAFMVALAVRSDGKREVIGFDVFDTEDNYSWTKFFEGLKARGLTKISMIISDSHKAIHKAFSEVYPDAAWQRCQVHLLRNITESAPARFKEGIRVEIRRMFEAETIEEARAIKDEIVKDYGDVAEKSMNILENGFEDSMTVMCFPITMRLSLRTTNCLERLNRELKRRSDIIQVFPNEDSVLRLMGAVTMEYSEQQAGIKRYFSESFYESIKPEIEKKLTSIATAQIETMKVA